MRKAHLDHDDDNDAEMQKVGELEFTVAADFYYRWDTLSKGRALFIVNNNVSGWTGLRDLKEWSAATPAWGGDLLLVRLRAAHGTTVFPGGAGGNGPA